MRVSARPEELVELLAGRGDRPALCRASDGHAVSYADLAARVSAMVRRLGPTRRLVLLEASTDVESVVAYLATLAGGHVGLVTAPDAGAALVAGYRPDVVIRGEDVEELVVGTSHDLHPDLALLLSTSGSTGSPKLVRLSRENLRANAEAIAAYLEIGPDDRAATTLPLHYCYGLSVLNSHLWAGASLLLTDRSVVEPEFLDDARNHGVTTFAGVPYTFDLLDRIDFSGAELPSLRYLTCAGGRLDPATARRFADLGRAHDFDLVVMYGQTEATARMSYLPAHLAGTAPESIGVPIPGGAFEVRGDDDAPCVDGEVGELVYLGPNVMLGYAETPADLALGRTVDALRTGDLGRRRPDGLYEVVGRRSRVAKVFGLRLDLDQVERALARDGWVVTAADGGDRLVLGVASGARPVPVDALLAQVRGRFGLPAAGVAVVVAPDLPRLPSGKPDLAGLVALAEQDPVPSHASAQNTPAGPERPGVEDVVAVFATVLRRPDARGADSFVSLGGDSLSYVEASTRLERLLGGLPAGWPTMPAAALVDAPTPTPRWGRRVETDVVLRALAILTIVGSHANVFTILGGAHLLLALVGYNLARFQLTPTAGTSRPRSVLRSVLRIAVPSVLVIGLASLWTPGLGWAQVLLLNGFDHTAWVEPAWRYWFVESVVHTLLVVALFLAVPGVDRLERRWPFALPVALVLVGLLTRYDILEPRGGDDVHRAHVTFWLFALGWAIARASTTRRRLLVSALAVATVPGFFDDAARAGYVIVGLLALTWLPGMRLPSWTARVVAVLASASLWIYLVHWEVYPWLEFRVPLLAMALALAAGVLAHWVAGRATDLGTRLIRRRAGQGIRQDAVPPGSRYRYRATNA